MQVAEDSWVLHELSSNQNIETGIKLEPILSSKNKILQEPSLSSRKLGIAWFVYILNCMIGNVLGYQRCANSSLKHIHYLQFFLKGNVCVHACIDLTINLHFWRVMYL